MFGAIPTMIGEAAFYPDETRVTSGYFSRASVEVSRPNKGEAPWMTASIR
jgi:hypothetical protein